MLMSDVLMEEDVWREEGMVEVMVGVMREYEMGGREETVELFATCFSIAWRSESEYEAAASGN